MSTSIIKSKLTAVERHGEIGISAMAAKAKAEVEARYVIALQRPRNINQARINILEACKRQRFAEGARYKKPVGGNKTVDGLSIRFAEEALKAMTNISTEAMIVWEDDQKRNIRVTVCDLETNTTYSDDIIISKTVERRQLKEGQEKLGERLNSYGEKVYLVAATEDDMLNKVNAAKSKVIRNNGLRLVPQDILEEAEEVIISTLQKGGGDPQAEKKKIFDAFTSIGVKPSELERFLCHSLETVSPKEIVDLRAIFSAIKDEETTWSAVSAQVKPKQAKADFAEPNPPKATPAPANEPATPTATQQTPAKAEPKPEPTAYNYLKALRGLMTIDKIEEAALLDYCREVGLAEESLSSLDEIAAIKPSVIKQIHDSWKTISKDMKF